MSASYAPFNLDIGTAAGDIVSQRQMGLGYIGNPSLVFKRKFRWTMEIQYCFDGSGYNFIVDEAFVKVAARPQLDIEETEINYLHGKFWIPGKVTFNEMQVTYYDVASSVLNGASNDGYNYAPTNCDLDHSNKNNNSDYDLTSGGGDGSNTYGPTPTNLFGWIASVYDFTDPCNLSMGSQANAYSGQGRIVLYDGCGYPLEGWVLSGMWPKSVNFGELDMGNSEEVTIELTLRYAQIKYISFCPQGSINKCACPTC
jgi:hypothetical protein